MEIKKGKAKMISGKPEMKKGIRKMISGTLEKEKGKAEMVLGIAKMKKRTTFFYIPLHNRKYILHIMP